MSGHNKWSTIKHKKAAIDGKRGRIFTKILKEITVAARLGGGDPAGNPRLRAAILEGRANNLPNDNVERAINKGTGELEGATYEELTYEGYGPAGVALVIEAMTDNKNRTVAEVRHIFGRHDGNLAESGSVSWMFKKRGYFAVAKTALDEDAFMELALELGADDAVVAEEAWELYTAAEDYLRVKEALAERQVAVEASQLGLFPQTYVPVPRERSRQLLRLIDALEDSEDVQNVWTNGDFDVEAIAADASA